MAAGMESECKWPFSSDVNLSMRGSCVDYAWRYAWGVAFIVRARAGNCGALGAQCNLKADM